MIRKYILTNSNSKYSRISELEGLRDIQSTEHGGNSSHGDGNVIDVECIDTFERAQEPAHDPSNCVGNT